LRRIISHQIFENSGRTVARGTSLRLAVVKPSLRRQTTLLVAKLLDKVQRWPRGRQCLRAFFREGYPEFSLTDFFAA
jgi:hypothetical protein